MYGNGPFLLILVLCKSNKLDQTQDKDKEVDPEWKRYSQSGKEWVHSPTEATPPYLAVAASLTF